MIIKIREIAIKNFRNITDLVIRFTDYTEIQAQNGVGKTNTLSAILWCLFGKNVYDEKNFTISPIIDNKEDDSLETIVKITMDNGYIIQRSWKKRKTEVQTGFIDSEGKENLTVVTQTLFNKELKEKLVDEETFKSLSNINYIPNLNWKDLKSLIFGLIGEIKDTEVLEKEDFKLTKEMIEQFGIERTQKSLKDTSLELDKDIKRLETEYQTTFNIKEKYTATEEEIDTLLREKEELVNKHKAIEEEENKIKEIERERNELTNDIKMAISQKEILKTNLDMLENKKGYLEESYATNELNAEEIKIKEICKVDSEIEDIMKKNKNCQDEIEAEEIKIKEYDEKTKSLKQGKVCPNCLQPITPEISEKINKNIIEQYRLKYKNSLNLVQNFKDMKEKNNLEIDKLTIYKEEIKNKSYKVDVTNAQKKIEEEINNLDKKMTDTEEKIKNIENEIQHLEMNRAKFFDIPTIPNQEEKLELERKIDELTDKIYSANALNKLNDDLEKIQNELENKRNSKLINKEKLQEIIRFNNLKANMLKEKVSKFFKLTHFRIKEFTQNGDEVETFKIEDENGIEYKELNSGKKLLIAIDLITGVQKLKDIFVPILVDNVECLSQDLKVENTQLIATRVVKGQKEMRVI